MPDPRREKIVRARELRAEGETYREIGEKLGVSLSAAYLWLNPEYAKQRARRSNAKRTAQKRRWAQENRAECPRCGQPMGSGSAGRSPGRFRPEVCRNCLTDEARARAARFIAMRKEGLLNVEIAEREGVETHVVATVLSRAYRWGLEVPPSPYYRRATESEPPDRAEQ